MSQTKKLTAAIKNNRPALLLGAAGTGKTATVHAISQELGMPVETLLLSGILPEDIGGLVRPIGGDNPTHFTYLPPEWAVKYGDKPFVLFLDEINQAAIQTLHALFYVVNDRTVAGIKLPNMRIVAAGNTADENEFLTPLPVPLMDRFIYKIKWKADINACLEHLRGKYPGDTAQYLLDAVQTVYTEEITPRHVEQMLQLIEDNTDDLEIGRLLVGAAYEIYTETLRAGKRNKEDDRLQELREISKKYKMGDGYSVIGGVLTRISKDELLEGLTPEEVQLVQAA